MSNLPNISKPDRSLSQPAALRPDRPSADAAARLGADAAAGKATPADLAPSSRSPSSTPNPLERTAAPADGRTLGVELRPRSADSFEVSPAARARLADPPADQREQTKPLVRAELVESVRGAIERGDYLTSERLDLALERMIGDYTSWLR